MITAYNCITLCSLTLPMKHSILNHQYVSIFRSMDPFFWKRSDFKTHSQIKSSTIIQIKQLKLKFINQYPIPLKSLQPGDPDPSGWWPRSTKSPSWDGKLHVYDIYIYIYSNIYIHIYIYIYTFLYMSIDYRCLQMFTDVHTIRACENWGWLTIFHDWIYHMRNDNQKSGQAQAL